MRDSSQLLTSPQVLKYEFEAQEHGVPRGPFLPDTAGVLKVLSESDSGEWKWEHGLHQAMNNM